MTGIHLSCALLSLNPEVEYSVSFCLTSETFRVLQRLVLKNKLRIPFPVENRGECARKKEKEEFSVLS